MYFEPLRGERVYGLRAGTDEILTPDSIIAIFPTPEDALRYLLLVNPPRVYNQPPLSWTFYTYRVQNPSGAEEARDMPFVTIPMRHLQTTWASEVNINNLTKVVKESRGSSLFVTEDNLGFIFAPKEKSDSIVYPTYTKQQIMSNNGLVKRMSKTLFKGYTLPAEHARPRVPRRGSAAAEALRTFKTKPAERRRPSTSGLPVMKIASMLEKQAPPPHAFLPINLHLVRRRAYDYDLANKVVVTQLFTSQQFGDAVYEMISADMSDFVTATKIPMRLDFDEFASDKAFLKGVQGFEEFVELVQKATTPCVICPFDLFCSAGGHANVVIVNREQKTVELFEPHGRSVQLCNYPITIDEVRILMQGRETRDKRELANTFREMMNSLEKDDRDDILSSMSSHRDDYTFLIQWCAIFSQVSQPLGYKFVPPKSTTCPIQTTLQYNFQKIPGRTVYAAGGAGQCQLISLYYVLVRLMMPNKSRDEIVEYINTWMSDSNNSLRFAQAICADLLASILEPDFQKTLAHLIYYPDNAKFQ